MSSRKFADKFTVMSLATMLIAIFSKTLLAGEATIYGEQGHTGSDSTQKNRRQPREYNKYIYPLRHLVENAFLHLKQWREIATQYAKNTASFLAAMHVRCIAIWAKIY